ncbi:hypothetical protein [Streptomyces sp. NPDC005498]|uniref:hypothetical protein n=1 Tax=Streptomyces sp. NPDC005498 TaxID=3364717 RepID=UPI0036C2D678
MSEQIFHSPDITGLPPKALLPKSLHKLYGAREAAYERWADFEADHAELTAPNWESAYAAKDEAAGRQAIADAVDPLSLPSALAQARNERPRVVGALSALVAEVIKADNALKQAVRRELGPIGEAIEQRITAAEAEYVAAQDAANAARSRYGAALLGRHWYVNHKLGVRTDYPDHAEAVPTTATEGEPADLYGRPIGHGRPEVDHINESFGRDRGTEPLVPIRHKVTGDEMDNVKESHAVDLVRKGMAEYVNPEDAERYGA